LLVIDGQRLDELTLLGGGVRVVYFALSHLRRTEKGRRTAPGSRRRRAPMTRRRASWTRGGPCRCYLADARNEGCPQTEGV
jgi:hypothetical protein